LPLLAILHSETLPRLVSQSRVVQQLVDPAGRRASAGQAGSFSASSPTVAVIWPCDDPRRVEPTCDASRYLGDIQLLTRHQLAMQFGFAAVALVEREPIEAAPVSDGPIVQLQSNPPLGPIGHAGGNPRLAAAVAIGVPALRQLQLTVEQTVEVLACET
jgi:hypothetical protein